MGRRGGRQATKRGNDRGQRAQGPPSRPGKPKACVFCATGLDWVDYKDVNTLRRLMSDRGKIKARRVTGTCRQHQRDVAIAIKTARELALLPYALSPAVADRPRRGGRRDSGPQAAGGGSGSTNGAYADGEPEESAPPGVRRASDQTAGDAGGEDDAAVDFDQGRDPMAVEAHEVQSASGEASTPTIARSRPDR